MYSLFWHHFLWCLSAGGSDLVLHGVVQDQRVEGPQPLNGVLGAHQSVGPPAAARHTGDSAAVRLQIRAAAAAEVVELHLPAARPVQQPAVRQQRHGGRRAVEQGQGEGPQRSLHRGEAVSGGDLEQTHRVLVGHRHVLLLGADGQAEHPGEALWRGDAERLLRQSQRVDEDGPGGQTAEQQPFVLSQLQTANLSRDRQTL